MPSKSEVQQQASGIALAAKRGDIPVSKLRGASKQMYNGMSGGQLRGFAATKHKGLPHKKALSTHAEAMEDDLGAPVEGEGKPITLEFLYDVEALVQDAGGVVDNAVFEKYDTLTALSIKQMPPPDSDMSKIILQDGRTLIINSETFQAVDPNLESTATQIVSRLLAEEGPAEEKYEIRSARAILSAVRNLQASLPNLSPEQADAVHTIFREANGLIRMHQ